MGLTDNLSDDMLNTILNNEEFSEDITYTPSGSSARTIRAIVDRQRTDADGADRGYKIFRGSEIHIANHATDGVATVTEKADVVSFPVHKGGTAVDWTVVEILSKDEGAWKLRVTRK